MVKLPGDYSRQTNERAFADLSILVWSAFCSRWPSSRCTERWSWVPSSPLFTRGSSVSEISAWARSFSTAAEASRTGSTATNYTYRHRHTGCFQSCSKLAFFTLCAIATVSDQMAPVNVVSGNLTGMFHHCRTSSEQVIFIKPDAHAQKQQRRMALTDWSGS